MSYDRKGSHCPWASLRDAACALSQSAVASWVVVGVSDVARVSVVSHDDVDWDACFDGDRADLLA